MPASVELAAEFKNPRQQPLEASHRQLEHARDYLAPGGDGRAVIGHHVR